MAYLPIICVIIGALFGWLFTRINIFSEEKKQERKRLRRLLYNMLELKHWIDKEIGADTTIKQYSEKFITATVSVFADKDPAELQAIQTLLTSGIKKMILKQPMLPALEKNIEEIIREFSELDPFFAFELTGRYKLTETLKLIKGSLNDIVPGADELPETTQIMDQLFRPKVLAELQQALIEHIPGIARKIDRHTFKLAESMLLTVNADAEDSGLEAYCNEMLPKMIQTLMALEASQLTDEQDLVVE